MADTLRPTRILVKAPVGFAPSQMSFGAAASSFQVQALLPSIDHAQGQGLAPGPVWQLLSSSSELAPNPWDICHRLVSDQQGFAANAGVQFAEPDLAQQWLIKDPGPVGIQLARTCAAADPQSAKYPRDPDDYWMRDARHSAFPPPPSSPPPRATVRIAHLDTGYDKGHKSRPRFLNTALQKNFVDPGRPNNAEDDTTGPFTNLGHGTGTLGILAGALVEAGHPLGGAPNADVVPIRVSNRVVLFYNSAIAQGFDYVHGLGRDPATRVDVVTMSMGGLPSRAWADAVNALYEQGVFIVTAAGNNYNNLPTRNIVYPAFFNRVVAACGVMADGRPYADLGIGVMAGNYGPDSKMKTAMAAATPNTPWARIGCPDIIDHDGNGTSSATPQIAAAAALWVEKNRQKIDAYSQPWMRVEAIRQALFSSAQANPAEKARLGHGALKALAALDVAPAAEASLRKQPADSAGFGFLSILLGTNLGIAGRSGRAMLELEALQLSQSAQVEALLPDPAVSPRSLSPKLREELREALLAHPNISQTLRDALHAPGTVRPTLPPPPAPGAGGAVEGAPIPPAAIADVFNLTRAVRPQRQLPARRNLRVYALDPALGTDFSTAGIKQAVIDIPWEKELQRGPVGEYIEVVDIDPASRCAYAPVDLNDPYLLAQNGLTPSEGNPQFHQQMCYAVAMRTIEFFERALGRRALWAPRITSNAGKMVQNDYVQRLRIYPHAIRAKNSFYSRELKALLLGYFSAPAAFAGLGLPQGVTFCALSHDIVAHETTHALLDGLHRRFSEATNPDVLAFHEAFADLVAIFQHFTMPEALKHAIRTTRGNLQHDSILSQLALEFGQSYEGSFSPLRSALGTMENGIYKAPERSDYDPTLEPHTLGGVLVSAVFAAFVTIYKDRADALVKLATGGTGILPDGDISGALVDALAAEASKVAGQVLRMCIRALDYCPPIDITFGEFLRALITADRDLVPDDPRNYRVAFVAAFRDRGIYPSGVRHLSPDNLVWEPPPMPFEQLGDILSELTLGWDMLVDRRKAFDDGRVNAAKFQKWLVARGSDTLLAALGLERHAGPMTIGDMAGTVHGIEVHSVRPARRIGLDGQSRTDLVVEITQTFYPSIASSQTYRGGCTVLIDLENQSARYLVRKRLGNQQRYSAQMGYRDQNSTLASTYSDEPPGGSEPFALLHRHAN